MFGGHAGINFGPPEYSGPVEISINFHQKRLIFAQNPVLVKKSEKCFKLHKTSLFGLGSGANDLQHAWAMSQDQF